MTTETTTLNRVREAQEALDKARHAMDRVQSGLSTVESMAEKAESARRHPVRTRAFALIVGVAIGALFAFKSLGD